jgi:transglutaminase-like putative cysteine protease
MSPLVESDGPHLRSASSPVSRFFSNRQAGLGTPVNLNSALVISAPIILTSALCVFSAFAWFGIFPSSSLIAPSVISVAAASAIAWLSRRRSAVGTLATAFVTVFVVAHLTVLRTLSTGSTGIPSGPSLRGFSDAFRNGWARILTSPIPMNFDVDRSLIFVIIVVLGSSAGMYFAVRERALPAAMVGPAIIAVAARLYGATTSAPWPALAVAIGSGSAILAALSPDAKTRLRKQPNTVKPNAAEKASSANKQAGSGAAFNTDGALNRPASRIGSTNTPLGFRGQALAAVLLTAVLGATIGTIALAATKKRIGDPYDPRRVAPLQNDEDLAIDPLSYVPYWAQNSKQKMFTASPDNTATTVEANTRWRIAVLDNFDGSRWLPNTRYTETGTLLPAPPTGTGLDTNAKAITVNVTIDELPERWLPVPGWPTQITGTAVSINQEHGVVLQRSPRDLSTSDGTAEGDEAAKTRYQVKALPLFSQAPSKLDGFATSQEARDNLATPKIPADLTNIAQTVASGATTPRERVALLETYLRSFYQFNPVAQPGHSYARIERLLRDQGAEGEGGTSEQFAVAFAMLARSLGIPTRVVVGFVVDPANTAPAEAGSEANQPPTDSIVPGTITVTAADAQAWPEVLFADTGWVPFDPTPNPGAVTREPKPDPAGANETATTVADTVPDTIPDEIEPALEVKKTSKVSPWIFVLLLGLLGLLGIVGLAALVVRKRQAKRRLQHGRQAIFGAWQEATRSLATCQQRIGAGDTLDEYAKRTAADERFQTLREPLTAMARACEKSQFSAEEPTESEITEAWAASDQVLQSVRATATPKEKALLLLDLRK